MDFHISQNRYTWHFHIFLKMAAMNFQNTPYFNRSDLFTINARCVKLRDFLIVRSEVYGANPIMKCKFRDCPYYKDEDINAKSMVRDELHLTDFHVLVEHTTAPAQPAPRVKAASGGNKPGKFVRPKVGVDKTTEKWEDFQTSWEGKHFTLDDAKLLLRIKELAV